MVVAVEAYFLTALLSAFIGLIALLALMRQPAQMAPSARNMLMTVVVCATLVAVGSFYLYARSPHQEARESVYGAGAP